MTKNRLDKLATKDGLKHYEVEELFKELRSVQESFKALVNNGEFSPFHEKMIRNHFNGTVCV